MSDHPQSAFGELSRLGNVIEQGIRSNRHVSLKGEKAKAES